MAAQNNDDHLNRVARLDLLAEFELSGIVQSLAVVRLPQAKADSLVVSFSEAKIAIVEWDPRAFTLRTVSLHFYENEPSLKVRLSLLLSFSASRAPCAMVSQLTAAVS